jgi:hypothetical protein
VTWLCWRHSPAGVLALSRDGRFAYVAETRKGAGAARTVAQLGTGENLTCVDLTNSSEPKVISSVYVGTNPRAVAVNAGGTLAAVVTENPRNQLVVVPLNGGAPGEPISWPLLGLDDDSAIPSGVCWRQDDRFLAVLLANRGEVVFYGFKQEVSGEFALAPWGRPVKVAAGPIEAKFTSDGAYLVCLSTGVAEVAQVPGVDDVETAVALHKLSTLGPGLGPAGQCIIRDLQIDEARAGDLDARKPRIARKPPDDPHREVARIDLQRLGRREGTVRLEIGQIRPVRGRDAGDGCVHAFGGEGGRDRFAEVGPEVGHWAGGVAAAWPAVMRKRLPVRLNSAISGVTSNPIRTSKLPPLVSGVARGMITDCSSVVEVVTLPLKSTGRSKYSLASTASFRSVTAIQ